MSDIKATKHLSYSKKTAVFQYTLSSDEKPINHFQNHLFDLIISILEGNKELYLTSQKFSCPVS